MPLKVECHLVRDVTSQAGADCEAVRGVEIVHAEIRIPESEFDGFDMPPEKILTWLQSGSPVWMAAGCWQVHVDRAVMKFDGAMPEEKCAP